MLLLPSPRVHPVRGAEEISFAVCASGLRTERRSTPRYGAGSIGGPPRGSPNAIQLSILKHRRIF